ncbi:hypothetical protein EMCRGX_G011165 [Ephydatia muelleri]
MTISIDAKCYYVLVFIRSRMKLVRGDRDYGFWLSQEADSAVLRSTVVNVQEAYATSLSTPSGIIPLLSLQNGWITPLMWASSGGHVTCVQLLLDRGAQINQQTKVYGPPTWLGPPLFVLSDD